MMIEKHILSYMNGDINERLLPQDACLNIMNGRFGQTEYGRQLRLENIPGTLQVSQSVLSPYGYNQCIGGVLDEQYNRIIGFIYNSFGQHCITSYDISTGITYAVLYDSQITGGFDFSRNSLIHSANVVNGILYFPDGTNNQPREIQIDAGIKANHPSYVTTISPYLFPINFSEITLIKPPPALAPNIQKAYDGTFNNNFISNSSFQFSFQYGYYTNEDSVTGAYSRSSRLNNPTDNYNYITVSMDGQENIPNTVRFVYLVVRTGTIAKVVKTWDKNVFADALAIANQNNFITQLSYRFYNNVTGRTLAKDLVLKQSDSIPYYAQTAEIAKNRLILGNVTEGDATPTTTSLAVSLLSTNLTASTLLKNLYSITHRNGRGGAESYGYSGWFVYLTEVVPVGWYALTATEQLNTVNGTIPTLPPAPPAVAFSGLAYRGSSLTEVVLATAEAGTTRWDGPTVTLTTNVVTITGITIQTWSVFKNKSQYKLGVQFYDFAMRPVGGVVTSDTLVASIPQRNYNYSTATTGLVWSISNASALTEIPDNAYYYCVMRTLNLKTRFFIESFTDGAKYVTKDADGQYEFNSDTYITNALGIGLDTTALIRSGLGYTFEDGDVCVLIKDDNTTYELPVIGQDGNYIIIKAQDAGSFVGARFVYEIYKPYRPLEQEPFYTVGEMYRILLPTTALRTYEIVSDTIDPDCYAITRNYNSTTYLAEAMCPNDLYYQRWDTDAGKLSLVLNSARITKEGSGAFSNVYIPGTSTNGLSTFEPLNVFDLPEEIGSLTKLILADKVQDEGTVLLAVCKNNISSIYLGQVIVTDATGANQYFAQSLGFIGTINILKESYGSVNAESVIQYKGLVFGYDVNMGVAWQYSTAGLQDIGAYGETRFFKRYGQNYLSASTGNLDNINGFHHIRFCIDPFHKELVAVMPGLIYENYADTLPSYSSVPSYASSIINRFDIYDGLSKSMIFRFEENKWGNNNNYGAEWLEYAGDVMYGWKNGVMWIHNADTTNWNTFYGVQQPLRACFTGNVNPSMLRQLFGIGIEGSATPNFTVAMTAVPNTQITDLQASDYTNQESVLYADFYRDRLSPNASGTADEKLFTGDLLIDFSVMVMIEFQEYSELIYINAVNLTYELSKGQKMIATAK